MGNLSFAQPPAPTSGTLGPPSAHIDEGVRASWGYPKCVSVMLISLASRVAVDVAPAGRARRPRPVGTRRFDRAADGRGQPPATRASRARGWSARVRAGFNSPDRDNAVVVDADKVSPTCPLPMNIETNADLPYSEASRRYRRTVYRHADWLEHRSSTRLFGNLSGTLTSGVVRSLLTEVAAVATISTLTCAWNGAVQGFVDWQSVPHDPILHLPSFLVARLPALPFTLASPALGLLLVFRTNASYARWVDSRVAWGRVVSHCRNIMRQSSTWMREDVNPAERRRLLHGIRGASWAFPRCLASHVSGPDDERRLRDELTLRVGERGANRLLRAPNRPLQALADLSRAVHQLPMDEKRRVEVDKSVILLGDALETCERIFTSPVPLVYTRHTARFLSCWLLLLPLALWEPFEDTWNHAAMIPSATLVAIFFFGIEELAVQLEEPFSILPLSRLCDGVWDSGVELFSTPAPEEEEEEEEGKEAPAAFEAAAESLPVGGRRR